MDTAPAFTFSPVELELKSLAPKDRKDQILQYNLDKSLQVVSVRFNGAFHNTTSDYESLLSEFFVSLPNLKALGIHGTPTLPVLLDMTPLRISVTNMGFFDKLNDSDVVGAGGQIRGCFDEIFDGVTVGDKLREMLLNPDSENSSLFSEEEKGELIFQLLRIMAVGGSLCQPDTDFQRYLDITKDLYKDLVTIYRDAKTDAVQLSGRAFRITGVAGLELFPGGCTDSPHHVLIALVDPLKKTVTIVRNTFSSFW